MSKDKNIKFNYVTNERKKLNQKHVTQPNRCRHSKSQPSKINMDKAQEDNKYNFSTTINMNTDNTSKNKHNKLTINNNIAAKSKQTRRIEPHKQVTLNTDTDLPTKWNTRCPRNINWTNYNRKTTNIKHHRGNHNKGNYSYKQKYNANRNKKTITRKVEDKATSKINKCGNTKIGTNQRIHTRERTTTIKD